MTTTRSLLTLAGRSLRRVHQMLTIIVESPLARLGLAVAALLVAIIKPALAFGAGTLAMIGSLSEGRHTGEFILSLGEGDQSVDTVTVTVPATTTLKAGTVLGKITATGKYVEYDDSSSDGSEDAAGVLMDNQVNDTGAPVDVSAAIVNAVAEVRKDDLEWKNGGVDKDKAYADLRALIVKARD